jgi:GNAT superfamily N-acetyltransferase
MPHVDCPIEPHLGAGEFSDLLIRSMPAERRPLDEPHTIHDMLRNADVIVTARPVGRLVGVARAISHFAYCTYLSDLAVAVRYQRQGIGRELIRRAHEAAGPAHDLDPAGGSQGPGILRAHRPDAA